MSSSLREISTAAAHVAGQRAGQDAPAQPPPAANRRRRPGPVRPVQPVKAQAQAPATAEAPPAASQQGGPELGIGGLRLAFCLCGLRNALTERQRRGEQLSERELLLLAMSARDFADMRPVVAGLTLARLDAIVGSPGPAESAAAGAMEIFALSTLRNLSERARHLLSTAGADAALSLFGDAAAMSDPLAIFETVFAASLDILEAFERMIPGESRLLSLMADALDSEIEKV